MTYKNTLLVSLLAVFTLGFTGCSTLQEIDLAPITESGEPERISVQYLTLKYIDGDAERASRVVDRVKQAKNVIANEEILVSELREKVDELIPWEDLDDEELFLVRELVNTLLNTINKELAEQVEAGLIPEDQLVYIDDYLTWIEDIAKLRAE